MAPVSPAAVRHECHIGNPHPAMAASAFCSGIPVPLPVSLLEKTSGESLHGKPKKALSVLLFHPRRIPLHLHQLILPAADSELLCGLHSVDAVPGFDALQQVVSARVIGGVHQIKACLIQSDRV